MRPIAVILVFLSVMPLSASILTDENLSLDQAVTMALQRNPRLLAAEKETAAAKGRRLQLEAIADPQIVLQEGLPLKKNDGAYKEYELGIEQAFEFPGKRALRGRLGRQGEELAGLETDRIKGLVVAAVKQAYYRVVLSSKTIESLEKSSALLDELLDNLVAKYRTGAASYGDVLRARAEKARLKNRIIEETKEGRSAGIELDLLLGRENAGPLVLTTDIVYAPFDRDLDSLKREMKLSRPVFKIQELNRNRAETGLALARKSRLPDFSLGLFSPSKRANAWGFSLGVTVPLWRTRQTGEILEARADSEAADIMAASGERRILAGIETAYSAVKAAESQVKVFEEHLLRDMEEEIKLDLDLFRYGRFEFTSLLDLYRSYTETRLEHLKSLYNYLTALADLEVAGEGGETN